MNDYIETPNDLAFQAGYKAGMKAARDSSVFQPQEMFGLVNNCTCNGDDRAKTVRVICLCPRCGGKVGLEKTREII